MIGKWAGQVLRHSSPPKPRPPLDASAALAVDTECESPQYCPIIMRTMSCEGRATWQPHSAGTAPNKLRSIGEDDDESFLVFSPTSVSQLSTRIV